MTPEMFQSFLDAVTKVVTQVGGAVWEAALRKVFIDGAVGAITWLVFFGVLIYMLAQLKQTFVYVAEYSNTPIPENASILYKFFEEDDDFVPMFILSISLISILVATGLILSIGNITQNIFNPQWQAIDLLLKTASGK
jgi:hypothetical protein